MNLIGNVSHWHQRELNCLIQCFLRFRGNGFYKDKTISPDSVPRSLKPDYKGSIYISKIKDLVGMTLTKGKKQGRDKQTNPY